MTATATYNLSSLPPIGSFMGIEPVTLLVGVEDAPDGALKVYLGARCNGLHLLVTDPDEQDHFRRAWGTGGHIWMWPLPPADQIHSDKASAEAGQ